MNRVENIASQVQFKDTELEFEDSGRIGIIYLTAAKSLNSLTHQMKLELQARLSHLRNDPVVKVIVLLSKVPKAFCSGADINAFKPLTQESMLLSDHFELFEKALVNVQKPLICGVNGFCLGGGFELALVCDVIYASEDAKFGFPEIKLGLIPGLGGTQRLTKIAGKVNAMRTILTGDFFDVKQAKAMNIVGEIFPKEKLKEEVLNAARRMSDKSMYTLMIAKMAIQRAEEVGMTEGLKYERHIFSSLFNQKAVKEGTDAFLNKRKLVVICCVLYISISFVSSYLSNQEQNYQKKIEKEYQEKLQQEINIINIQTQAILSEKSLKCEEKLLCPSCPSYEENLRHLQDQEQNIPIQTEKQLLIDANNYAFYYNLTNIVGKAKVGFKPPYTSWTYDTQQSLLYNLQYFKEERKAYLLPERLKVVDDSSTFNQYWQVEGNEGYFSVLFPQKIRAHTFSVQFSMENAKNFPNFIKIEGFTVLNDQKVFIDLESFEISDPQNISNFYQQFSLEEVPYKLSKFEKKYTESSEKTIFTEYFQCKICQGMDETFDGFRISFRRDNNNTLPYTEVFKVGIWENQ